MFLRATSSPSFFKTQVSKLCQHAVCPRKAKILIINQDEISSFQSSTSASEACQLGSQLHKSYLESIELVNFDREILKLRLMQHFGRCLQRRLTNDDFIIDIRGIPDDYRCILNPRTQEHFVVLIEVKTTSKTYFTLPELAAAQLQLQIYMWLAQPYLEKLGYKIHHRGYIEIYNQKSGLLLHRQCVAPLPNPEQVLHEIIYQILGLHPMQLPSLQVCKHCPKEIKSFCGRT